MIDGSLGVASIQSFPGTVLQEHHLPPTLTPRQLPTFLGTHQPHLLDKLPLLFGPTGGPAADPGLLHPGADRIRAGGTEDNLSKQTLHPTGMGKSGRSSSRGHYGPWPSAQVPTSPVPCLVNHSFPVSSHFQSLQQKNSSLHSRLAIKRLRQGSPFTHPPCSSPGCLQSPKKIKEFARS